MDAPDRSSAATDPVPSHLERRRHARVGIMWMATLRSATGFFECMIIDVSRGGAKLKLTEPHSLPGAVTLVLGGIGTFRARLAWQRGEYAGIAFTDTPETIVEAFGGRVP